MSVEEFADIWIDDGDHVAAVADENLLEMMMQLFIRLFGFNLLAIDSGDNDHGTYRPFELGERTPKP